GYGRELLHDAMVQLAKRRMRKAIGPEDHLRQAVGALDELQEEENVLVERLREWYGLHFPELARMVDTATYVELVSIPGRRERSAPSSAISGPDRGRRSMASSSSIHGSTERRPGSAAQSPARSPRRFLLRPERTHTRNARLPRSS